MIDVNIIPAIDILGGKCAQLVGGNLGTEKYYGNPIEIALNWVNNGAKILHVIDLDAALGKGSNLDTILNIREATGVRVQVGGGIRTTGDAKILLDSGIDRVILGTFVVNDIRNNLEDLNELRDAFGPQRLMVSVDSRDGFVAVSGWKEKTSLTAVELIKKTEKVVWGFLYTDIDVEGQMKGINLKGIEEVVGSTNKPVIISGGISTKEDVEDIKKTRAWGVVLGKALYEGRLNLQGLIND